MYEFGALSTKLNHGTIKRRHLSAHNLTFHTLDIKIKTRFTTTDKILFHIYLGLIEESLSILILQLFSNHKQFSGTITNLDQ